MQQERKSNKTLLAYNLTADGQVEGERRRSSARGRAEERAGLFTHHRHDRSARPLKGEVWLLYALRK